MGLLSRASKHADYYYKENTALVHSRTKLPPAFLQQWSFVNYVPCVLFIHCVCFFLTPTAPQFVNIPN